MYEIPFDSQKPAAPWFLSVQQVSKVERSTRKKDLSVSIVTIGPPWPVSNITTAPGSNRRTRPEIAVVASKVRTTSNSTVIFKTLLVTLLSSYQSLDLSRLPTSARGPPFSNFPLDHGSRLQDTTPVRQRRGTGLAFPGGRPFSVLKGSGVWASIDSTSMPGDPKADWMNRHGTNGQRQVAYTQRVSRGKFHLAKQEQSCLTFHKKQKRPSRVPGTGRFRFRGSSSYCCGAGCGAI